MTRSYLAADLDVSERGGAQGGEEGSNNGGLHGVVVLSGWSASLSTGLRSDGFQQSDGTC